ncbi:response regulator [Ramlibacter sp. MMS24-I3-19]|uniref:response regulator n=1 Tax=Ramlibacter sp. MMS24-I3-19 TaxID=3416606 RepID=UPI003CFC09C8
MEFLLVDDDWIARQSLANIVRGIDGAGEVLQAEDGEQTWDMLQAGLRPVLCCCDIRMPRLDGLGFLQRVRSQPLLRHLPVVLITAASDIETVRSALQAGADGYILKPFLAQQTRATLVRVLVERLATEAEPVGATLRRLDIDREQLLDLLDGFRADALEARIGAADPKQLRRLHGKALRLGQWRSAGLLRDLLDEDPAGGLRLQVLDEIAGLARRQQRMANAGPERVHATERTGFLPQPALPWLWPAPQVPRLPGTCDPEPYRPETLLLQFDGVVAMFRKARCMFLDQAPSELRAIGDAASRGDAHSARQLAHKLQGSAGIVGAALLAWLCELIAAGTREPGAEWVAHAQAALDAYRAASVAGAA